MNRRTFVMGLPAAAVASATKSANADLPQPIVLAKPDRVGGKSVLAALWERRTNRAVGPRVLPARVLSNLLWAAWGVNRPNGLSGGPGRTAASASNSQEIDLYVMLPDGVYLYEAVPHRLAPVVVGDKRALAGGGAAAAAAPVNLVFVADLARYAKPGQLDAGPKDTNVQKSFYYVATGLIAGNVYLFAASQGLAAWFHTCDKAALASELHLRPDQRILYAQTVGFAATRS